MRGGVLPRAPPLALTLGYQRMREVEYSELSDAVGIGQRVAVVLLKNGSALCRAAEASIRNTTFGFESMGYKVRLLNVSPESQRDSRFSVVRVPQIRVFDGGRLTYKHIGAPSPEEVLEITREL